MNSKPFSPRDQARRLMIIVLLSLVAWTRAGGLIHGLAIRDATKPQQPAEIEGDLFFLRQAVSETSFSGSLKKQLDLKIVGAQQGVRAIVQHGGDEAPPVEAGRARGVRRRVDTEIEGLLAARQIDELNRRTAIICLQEILLADGARSSFEQTARAAGIHLSEEQNRKLVALFDDEDPRIRDAGGDRSMWRRQLEIIQATRDRIRTILTEDQSRIWDDFSANAMRAVSAPSATQPGPTAK